MNHLLVTLEITALGMGLVFAALILLWWMMALLTKFMVGKETPAAISENETDSIRSTSMMDQDSKARAAAIAVAIALAEHEVSLVNLLPTPPTAIVSAWQLGMRTRQLYQKGMPIRSQRKVG